jgi:hypothetical protein
MWWPGGPSRGGKLVQRAARHCSLRPNGPWRPYSQRIDDMVVDAIVMCARGLVAWPGAIQFGLVMAVAMVSVSDVQAPRPRSVMVKHDMRVDAAHDPGHNQDHRESDGVNEPQGSGRTEHTSSV